MLIIGKTLLMSLMLCYFVLNKISKYTQSEIFLSVETTRGCSIKVTK